MRWLLSFGLMVSVCGIAAGQSPPSNNDCDNAQEIYLGTTSFSTVDATTDGDTHNECDSDGQTYNDIWYTFTSGASGTLVISTCGLVDYDSDLVAYYGDDCNNLEFAGCNDDGEVDGDDCFEYSSYLEVPVLLGNRMTIRVGGWHSGDQGSGDIFLDIIDVKGNSIPSPANDDCVNAVEISEGDYYFTTIDATTDGPAHSTCEVWGDGGVTGNDVWYLYTAPTSGTLTLSTCNQSDFDTDLVIYDNTNCSNLSLLGCNDDGTNCDLFSSHLVVKVVGGTEYLVRVGGYNNFESGTGILSVSIVGDTVTWVGASGDTWFDGSNWSSGVVPTASVDIAIDGSVTIDQAGAVAATVTVQNGGNLIMESVTSSLTTSSFTVDTGGNLNWKGGTIDVSYGDMEINQSLSIGCLFDGTLIAKGTLITADDITICSGGTMITTSWVTANFVSNMGTLSFAAVDSEIGYMFLDGDYDQLATGRLEIDIDSTGTGGVDFDFLGVVGTSTIDGTVVLRSHDGFQPIDGNGFGIISNSNDLHSGSFSNIEMTGFVGGVAFSEWPMASGTSMLASATPVIYVDADNSSGDGTSWGNAYPTIQEAIDASTSYDEIWIAEGTYYPGNSREDTFNFKARVTVYGGFDGTETSVSQRDIEAHPTILSGNFAQTEDRLDDAYHVVTYYPIWYYDPITIDGLTIQNGYANNSGITDGDIGAGILHKNGDLTLNNCTLYMNYASNEGGGVHVYGDDLYLNDCVFLSNSAAHEGGGLYAEASNVEVNRTTFELNRVVDFYGPFTSYGGGLYIEDGFGNASLTIDDSYFKNNNAFIGMGIADGGTGGALYAHQTDTTITNTVFDGNSAFSAGAVHFQTISVGQIAFINRCTFINNKTSYHVSPFAGAAAFQQADGQTMILDCLFAGNDGEGEAIIDMGTSGGFVNRITNCTIAFNDDLGTSAAVTGTSSLENTIIWFNEGAYGRGSFNQYNGNFVISSCIIDNHNGGSSNTYLDPLFRDTRGPDGIMRSGDEDYRLLAGSPAIDFGNDNYFDHTGIPQIDLDGNNRFQDDPFIDSHITGSIIDVGCYEFTPQQVGVPGFRSWTGEGNDYFSDATNWQPAEVPSIADTVINNRTDTVYLNSSVSVDRIIFNEGTTHYALFNNTLTCTADYNALLVGGYEMYGGATAIFLDGTVIADRIDIQGGWYTSAALGINSGTTLQTQNSTVVRARGTLYGGGTVDGDLINAGTVSCDYGHVTYPNITGNYSMNDHPMSEIDDSGTIWYLLEPIDHDSNNSYDAIDIDGVANLGGLLYLSGGGDVPEVAGQSITILNATGGINGDFDSIWSDGFSEDIVPLVSIVDNGDGSESVIVEIQSVSSLVGFGNPNETDIDSLPNDAETADIDGDGYVDLILSLPSIDSLLILYNGGVDSGDVWNGFSGGSQQLTSSVGIGDHPAGLTAADFDDDGDIDIAVVNTNDDTVTVLINQTIPDPAGRGITFTHVVHATDFYGVAEDIEAKPTDVAHGNFNGDSFVDLVIANSGDAMLAVINGPVTAANMMPGGGNYGAPGGSSGVNPGDVNNDKDLDAINVTGPEGKTTVLKGNTVLDGHELYGSPIVINMGTGYTQQIITDIDGNNWDDILVINEDSGNLNISLQITEGVYTPPVHLPLPGNEPKSMATIDLDEDGDLDLAVVVLIDYEDGSGPQNVTRFLRNDSPASGGTVMFTDINHDEGLGLNPVMARAGDVDNDGKIDLLMIGENTGGMRSVGSSQTVLNHFNGKPLCPEDINGDGFVDVDDLLLLIGAWGDTTGPADINLDGIVDVNDMLALIGAWGSCPR